MSNTPVYIALACFAMGALAATAIWHWRARSAHRAARRIPKEWPLKARPLVNSKERRVWLWLSKVMFDQQILIKLPVTRFTAPARAQEAEQWFKLLNGVYCTFTVCDMDGRVIGCVDVPGKRGLSMGNQGLKHSLLSQCNIQYWVVEPDNLPHLTQIRAAFLGEESLHAQGGDAALLNEKLRNVDSTLQAAVSKQRSQKSSAFSGDAGAPSTHGTLPSNWEVNSFLVPLDSRADDLRE